MVRASCVGLEPEPGDLTNNHISLGFLNKKLLPSVEHSSRSRSRSRSTTFASRSKSRSKRDLLRADQGCGKESCLGNSNLEISCGKMQGKYNSNSMLGCGKEKKIGKCAKNCGKAGTGCEEKEGASESLTDEAFGFSRKKHHNCREEPEQKTKKLDEKCYQETHSTDQCSATIENKETTTRYKTKNVAKSREHETSKKVDTSESHQHCSSTFFKIQNDKGCKNRNKVSAFTTWPDQLTTTRDHFSTVEDHFMTTEDHYSGCTVEDHQETSFAKMSDARLPSNLPMTRITCTICHHDRVSPDQKKKARNNNKHDCVIGNMEKISEEVRGNHYRFDYHLCINQLHRTFHILAAQN